MRGPKAGDRIAVGRSAQRHGEILFVTAVGETPAYFVHFDNGRTGLVTHAPDTVITLVDFSDLAMPARTAPLLTKRQIRRIRQRRMRRLLRQMRSARPGKTRSAQPTTT